MNGHIVLLGDSIFDNAVYVPGGPSVIEHVRRVLPRNWEATLLAVDGATISSMERQFTRMPDGASRSRPGGVRSLTASAHAHARRCLASGAQRGWQ